MDQKLKRLLQQDMEKEADHITEMLANLPEEEKEDLPKAEYMDVLARLQEFAQTEAKLEADRKAETGAQAVVAEVRPAGDTSRLSSEEQELIRLGTIYKKRRNWNRLAILVAALVCVLSLGLTATGGPEKLFEEVKRMMSGREQTRINTDSDRIEAVEGVSEEDAYQKIEDEFNVYPVRMGYMPKGMEFVEFTFYKNMQQIQLIYEGHFNSVITYAVCPNYRTNSTAIDVEDKLIKEYNMVVGNVVVNLKQYQIKESNVSRWIIDFKCGNVQYIMRLTGIKKEEVEKIVENLIFS